MSQTNAKLLIDLENFGGAGYRGADRIRMLDAEVLELETQLAAYRKSEPEHQAQMKWARETVSNVIIPPASTDNGDSPHMMLVKLKEDDHRFNLKAGDVLEVEPYWLDPSDKFTVIRRVSDGLDPSCNVYRSQVTPLSGGDEHG